MKFVADFRIVVDADDYEEADNIIDTFWDDILVHALVDEAYKMGKIYRESDERDDD